jgi:hypothetical protein
VVEAFADQLSGGQQDARRLGGSASSSAMQAARCFFDIRPCSTNSGGTCAIRAWWMASRCSVRSVSTSTLRPCSNASPHLGGNGLVRA